VAALRKAFIAAMRDKDVQAEAKRVKLDLQADSGEELQKMLERMYATPKEIVERARAALNAK
jgi:tripartite-type tricarboxylate transporter receptor subunit TctC